MLGIDIKLVQNVKSFICDVFTNEFYYFMTILSSWLCYIWLRLDYIDQDTLPLNQNSIESMSSSSFEETMEILSPHFAEFERNCQTNHENYTLDYWIYITSVVFMDWTFRIIYLFIAYKVADYLQNKYQCRITTQ